MSAFVDLVEQVVAVIVATFGLAETVVVVLLHVLLAVLVDAPGYEGLLEVVALGERAYVALLVLALVAHQHVVVLSSLLGTFL